MYDELKKRVCAANILLHQYGLAPLTWGNVSELDAENGVVAIKPSGVPYGALTPDDIVILDLDGNRVCGARRPSSDTKTHLCLYRAFPEVRGIVHTHSPYAAAWAQACRDIPVLGTTHADCFHGPVPCVRVLTQEETEENYEGNTGKVIAEHFRSSGINPLHIPAALAAHHGPFVWGKSGFNAVENAYSLEEIAKMALLTERLTFPNPAPELPGHILSKHFERKHGKNAYYGQG